MENNLEKQQQTIKRTEVNGPITLDDIFEKITQEYDLGNSKPENIQLLSRGLETVKYTFWAEKRLLLAKVFDNETSRHPRFRLRNRFKLEEILREAEIPIEKTIEKKKGGYFILVEKHATPNRLRSSAVMVSEIFPGATIQNPSSKDVQKITEYMARIHQIKDYGVVPAFDSWSLLRLVKTFNRDKNKLSLAPVLELIAPVVAKVEKLNLENEQKFPKTLVHGDLHPFNILKGPDGYCILDLGCMDHEQRIADLAIFLSMTCADYKNPEKTKELFQTAIDSYEKRIKLTPEEKRALPILVKANYAMFALKTAELLIDDPDNSELKMYHKKGIDGLKFVNKTMF